MPHWRTRAPVQKVASAAGAVVPAGSGPGASAAGTANRAATSTIGTASCAATSATPASNRSSHRCAAATVAGGASQAVSRSLCRRASGAGAAPPTASARIRSVSVKPSNQRRSRILSSASASSPGRRVSRWPARFPLSTDRDVERRQRRQRARVVPVVEMPFVARQAVHRAHRVRRAPQELPGRDVPEIAGGQIGEQRQPHVRRRRAMRDARDRMFLPVVRRQPLVVGADEGLEERPGPARELAQEQRLLRRQSRLAAGERPADPPRDAPVRRTTGASIGAATASADGAECATSSAAAVATAGAIHIERTDVASAPWRTLSPAP